MNTPNPKPFETRICLPCRSGATGTRSSPAGKRAARTDQDHDPKSNRRAENTTVSRHPKLRRAIGIRIALGADHKNAFSLIMKQGAQQIPCSVFLGLALSLLVGRALATMLVEVSPSDPLALALAAVVLSVAALAACYLPARHVTRIDPTIALHAD